jgi:hypothetical protein
MNEQVTKNFYEAMQEFFITPPPATEMDTEELQLQTMAITNWPAFKAFVGEKIIEDRKICLRRWRGQTYGQISNKKGHSKQRIRHICNVCKDNVLPK